MGLIPALKMSRQLKEWGEMILEAEMAFINQNLETLSWRVKTWILENLRAMLMLLILLRKVVLKMTLIVQI